mmetsp:Transcript_5284/g.6473  ORF Transcript_5284/g.6473 Transcript_5284/m.6473 type:complete len:95 (-) Transcript_5284:888-1172(-)
MPHGGDAHCATRQTQAFSVCVEQDRSGAELGGETLDWRIERGAAHGGVSREIEWSVREGGVDFVAAAVWEAAQRQEADFGGGGGIPERGEKFRD